MYPSSRSRKHNRKKVIIFDFDGVLADTFNTFYSLIKDCAKEIGLKLSPNQYRGFFIGNVHTEYKKFIKDREKLGTFLKIRKANYDKYYFGKKTEAKLFSGTGSLIEKTSKKNILAIASSGYTKNIKKLLGKSKTSFSLILAGSDPKEIMIKEILNKFKKRADETTMITDALGDIKAAKRLGLKTIAVTWGFHDSKVLKKGKPDKLVKSFKELEKLLLDPALEKKFFQ